MASTYAFAFGFVVGPAVGARGLEPTGPLLHVLIFVMFSVSLATLLVSVAILLFGFFTAVRRESAP